MLVRKPLVLAMLAAGIIASDGLPEAQSTVFVPELAMLDGALCTGTMATTPFQPLLLAQMKTEVSPAAKAAASAAPAPAAADQPLIAGLGARSFKITTSSKQAQQYFDSHGGYLDENGEPSPASKTYWLAYNSTQRALQRLEEHVQRWWRSTLIPS